MSLQDGVVINLEGPEGSRKTTAISSLTDGLRSRGFEVVTFREPGGTSISEQIRDILHDMKNQEIHFRTETLLYQASRAQLVAEKIIPAKKEGKIVVLDRFADSTLAYQGGGRGINLEDLKFLIKFATQGLKPDLSIYMNIDVRAGLARRSNSGVEWNRMDAQEVEFYEKTVAMYKQLIAEDPERWRIVDASKCKEEVAANLLGVVLEYLQRKSILESETAMKERR